MIAVPFPGGPLVADAPTLRAWAQHMRQEVRRLVPVGAGATAQYDVRLPTGRHAQGTAGALLRLADRLADAADPPHRARGGPPGPAPAAHAAGHATQRLDAAAAAGFDPADADSPPGPGVYRYWGALWTPDAAAPDGWAAGPEVEVQATCLGEAVVQLVRQEQIAPAADEILAVRWTEAAAPTCFVDAARVVALQQLLLAEETRHAYSP